MLGEVTFAFDLELDGFGNVGNDEVDQAADEEDDVLEGDDESQLSSQQPPEKRRQLAYKEMVVTLASLKVAQVHTCTTS